MKILPNPSLSSMTTLGLGGTAIAEVVLEEAVDAYKIEETCKKLGGEPYFVGGGSNLLAADGELPLVVVRPAIGKVPIITREEGGKVFVRAGAGVKLQRLLGFCANNSLSGLERLCGIPGTVGGAAAMNAGSFGLETGESIEMLRVFAPGKGMLDVSRKMIDFAYRRTNIFGINQTFLIIHALFALTKSQRSVITNSMRLNFFKKKSTQPLNKKSAGCVFKNPGPDLYAGKLLQDAGFRGKGLGGMAFSKVHANFLINEGNGSAKAAFDLIGEARSTVKAKFGINLELEVKVLPEGLAV